MQEAVFMKSFRLLGLFLVSLFLAACWLSSLPAAEHPWDEDEVVTSDTNGVIHGNGGTDTDGGTSGIIIILPSDFSPARVLGNGMLYLRSDGGFNVRKSEVHHSSRGRAGEPGIVLPWSRLSASEK